MCLVAGGVALGALAVCGTSYVMHLDQETPGTASMQLGGAFELVASRPPLGRSR